MKIWIDICHTPQVVFYIPIIRQLMEEGFSLLVTVQESSESVQLLGKAGIPFYSVGKKFGKNKLLKIIGLVHRSIGLWRIVRFKKIHLGVSQGSPYQILVCLAKRIPTLSITDNEHADWTFTRLSDKILVPEFMSDRVIKASLRKITKFPGLKEEVYLTDFRPDPGFLNKLNLDANNFIVTLRSPASSAHYYNPETAKLLKSILIHLIRIPKVRIVYLPRNNKEKMWITGDKDFEFDKGKIIIPDRVLDGFNLLWHSDAVFSGGGTMIREAAILGVPAYSYYQGKMLSVDAHLLIMGKLKFINNAQDVQYIKIQKVRKNPAGFHSSKGSKTVIINQIRTAASKTCVYAT